jgi:hypothetical protein
MSMSMVSCVLVHGVTRAALAEALVRVLADAGLEPTSAEDTNPGTSRYYVRSKGSAHALVLASPQLGLGDSVVTWLEAEWAAQLSRALGGSALAVSVWEGERSGARAQRFAGGNEVEQPSRFATVAAAAKSLAVPRAWLRPEERDALAIGDLVLAFRRRHALPVLPMTKAARGKKHAQPTGLEAAAAAYRGRDYAVGTVAFGAACDLETVSTLFSTFVRAFCPPGGLGVRVSRGSRSEVLPARFSPTASVSAKQVARGGSVELTESDTELEHLMRPLFWITSRPPSLSPEDETEDGVRVSFGWCIARPGAERPELAITQAMSTMIETAAEAEGCLSALLTAQGRPLTLRSSALAYESLAETEGRGADARWLRAHVRSPGWAVLVPRAGVSALSRPPPSCVSLERVASGLLVRSDAPTPFAMTETEAQERWLLPLLG